MCMREKHGGKLLWTLNLVVLGGGRCSFDPPRSHKVGLWKNIRRGWRLFFSHTRFELRDGSNIRFWVVFGVEG